MHAFEVQTGVGLLHSESFRHCTHEWLVVSHTPIEQSVFWTQATHCPVPVSHAWFVLPEQSEFEVQPRHSCVVPSQMGVEPEHCESTRHATHVSFVGSHTGVGDEQSLFERHATHLPALAPVVAHSGVGAVQSLAVQARHVSVPVSQMGVLPEQFALLVHATHVPLVVLQAGVGATHALWFVAEHWPQAPEG